MGWKKMGQMYTGQRNTGRGRFGYRASRAGCAVAAAVSALFIPTKYALADNGLAALRALDPTLTGSGVNVAVVEADLHNGVPPEWFEINPTSENQPASLFTYINESGTVSTTFSASNDSSHAETVASNFFSTSIGVAPGVSHVDDYSASYFASVLVDVGNGSSDAASGNQFATLHSDKIINQSYTFGTANSAQQAIFDYDFDLYEMNFPATIFVTAAGAAPTYNGGKPTAPGTAYNSITVNVDAGGGNQVTGPSVDGRDKPDIEAYGTTGGPDTSYATPMVSGAAAVLVQAGARGDGGTSAQTKSDAVDPRVVKALLMNGATKDANWSTGISPTSPLNHTEGAGDLNLYNSYVNLTGGEATYGFTDTQSNLIATPTTTIVGTPAPERPEGWNFTSLSSGTSMNVVQHYIFNPIGAGTTSFTATMDWWRNPTIGTNTANPINNIFLYLFDDTTSAFVDTSVDTVDNEQLVFANGINANNKYDLIVMKLGGTNGTRGVVSALDTYGLAWNFAPINGTWQNNSGGSWTTTGNWSNSTLPNSPGGIATFGTVITSAQTITLNGIVTVGQLAFNDGSSYNIAPGSGGSLTLDNLGIQSNIYVNLGNHTISAPVTLASPGATFNVAGGWAMTLSGTVSGPGKIVKSNLGTLNLSGSNSYTGGTTNSGGGALVAIGANSLPAGGTVLNNNSLVIDANNTIGTLSGTGTLTINNGATLKIAANNATSFQSGLTLNGTGTLDITNNAIAISYSGASPVNTIRNAITAGFHGGSWTGTGITSSTAANDASHGGSPYFGNAAVGYADNSQLGRGDIPASSILVRLTYYGDTDLNGVVNGDDFSNFLAGFIDPKDNPPNWVDGDFDYSGVTNGDDFSLFLSSFQANLGSLGALEHQIEASTLSPSQQQSLLSEIAAVPEPASISLLGCAAGLFLRRKRRYRVRTD